MNDSELIDWEQAEMIFGEDEIVDEDMMELFQEFVEDGHDSFERIQQGDFDLDKELIAKQSHKLKGSACNFGFTKVALLLGRIEDEIDSLAAEDYRSSLDEAQRSFGVSVDCLTSRYRSLQVSG